MFIKRRKVESFQFLVDRIQNKLTGWKARNLSWAGRTTLIQSIINIMPIYQMTTFKIPTKIYRELDRRTRDFWWNKQDKNDRCFTPVSQNNLCQPKKC